MSLVWPERATDALPEDRGGAREFRRPPRKLLQDATAAPADALFRGSGAGGSYRSASGPASSRASEQLLRLADGPYYRGPDPSLQPSLLSGGRVGSDRVLP